MIKIYLLFCHSKISLGSFNEAQRMQRTPSCDCPERKVGYVQCLCSLIYFFSFSPFLSLWCFPYNCGLAGQQVSRCFAKRGFSRRRSGRNSHTSTILYFVVHKKSCRRRHCVKVGSKKSRSQKFLLTWRPQCQT